MLRSLLVLLLGAMILSEAAGAAPADDKMPPPPERLEPVASFAYVEPVRRDGVVAYVVHVHGGPSAGEITVRVRELSEGGGEGDVLFGSDDGPGTAVTSGAVPGAGPDGRPWPLLFAEPPPPGASNRQFRVELAVNDTVTVQQLGVSAGDRRWQTFSRRIRLAARPDAGLPPLAFREAQDQNTRAEQLLSGRSAIVAVSGLLLLGLALGIHWAPREGPARRPSPEQRGTEGRGVLVMLLAVAVASGAMLVGHLVGR